MLSFAATVLFGEIGQLLRTVGILLLLGLVMAFSPTTFGIEIGAIEHGHKARPRVLLVAGGVATAATILAALFLVVRPSTIQTLWTGDVRGLLEQHWFDAAVGVLLVAAGTVSWVRAARPRREHRSWDRLDRPRVLLTVVVTESLISTTGPATMYLVVVTIGTTPPELWPVGYVIFLIGLAAPYVFLAIALTRIPAAARRLSEAQAALGRRDLRRPVAVGLVAVGLALVTWAVATMRAT